MDEDDGRRGLTIEYNLLNLPSEVTGTVNGTTMTANYEYLPDGTKLSTADNSGSGFAYLGSLVYRKDGSSYTFESTDFSGGRLDNGLSMSATNRYRFSGKEQQTVADVDLLDFGARFYDDEICRWTTIDPLAKKYFSMTPYNYCGNDPVNFVDPMGMNWYEWDGNYKWVDSADDTYTDEDGNEWNNIGSSYSFQVGDVYYNCYENEIIKSSSCFNAKDYILSRKDLLYDMLSNGSNLCESGQIELYEASINKGRQDFLNHPVTQQVLISLGGMVLGGIAATFCYETSLELEYVYRVFGGESKMMGRSWTPSDPSRIINYRKAAGLPIQNSGTNLVKGVVDFRKIEVSHLAYPLHGNSGGGIIEYEINPKYVKFLWQKTISPHF